MADISTRLCSRPCYCCTQSMPGKTTAWSEAWGWWTGKASDHMIEDMFRGVCCMPCQLGVIKTADSARTSNMCPGDTTGTKYCVGTAVCMCCNPLVAVLIEGIVVDESNNADGPDSMCPECLPGTGLASAVLWAYCAPYTCAHCIIGKHARTRPVVTPSML
jgi:hypothetical protein